MIASAIAFRAAFIAIAAVALAGCGSRESQVERAVERELPRIIGPAESYEVGVQGIRGAAGAGLVTVRGTRVRPAGSPTLDRISIRLVNVLYNPDCTGVQSIAGVEGRVGVVAADIAAFLEGNRNLQNVEVTLQPPNVAVVRAQPEIPQLQLPAGTVIEATGTLGGVGPLVNYEVSQVSAAGLTLSDPAPGLLSDAINPVIDLSGMPLMLQFGELQVDGGMLIADVTGRYVPQ